MQPNFKTEQILKNNVIILTFLLKLKGFFNFFASVNAYGTLWNHFQLNKLINFKNMLKRSQIYQKFHILIP